jgi:hypothetical protein
LYVFLTIFACDKVIGVLLVVPTIVHNALVFVCKIGVEGRPLSEGQRRAHGTYVVDKRL